MKAFVTALGICALLLAPATANGADDYSWNGATSAWRVATNWDADGAGTDYPGQNVAGDTGRIETDTANDTVIVSGVVANDVYSVFVDAEGANVDLELQIASGGDLDVLNSGAGYIRLRAGRHGLGVPDDATLEMVDTGTDPVLRVDYINCDGGTTGSYGDGGKAVINSNMSTIAGYIGDVDVAGDVQINITGSVVFRIDALTLENGNSAELHVSGSVATSDLSVSDYTPNDGVIKLVGPMKMTHQ